MPTSPVLLIFYLPVAAFGVWLCYIGLLNKGDTTTRHVDERALCAGCGYSLHSLTRTRCPECGDRLKRTGTIYPITPKQRFWRTCRRIGFFGFGAALCVGIADAALQSFGLVPLLYTTIAIVLAWTLGIGFIIHTERRESRALRAAAPKGWRPPNLKLTNHTDHDT